MRHERSFLSKRMNYAIPAKQIRAAYDDQTIRVYQAYSHTIAESALARGTFVSPPFKMERMTWIKPSFLWMMYRAGWGFKDDGQCRILAIDISREGFDWALANSSPSHRAPGVSDDEWKHQREAPVRVQWDPERDLLSRPLPHRSIQVGLSGETVKRYVNEWIRKITDVTSQAHAIHDLVEARQIAEAERALPAERAYPFDGSK